MRPPPTPGAPTPSPLQSLQVVYCQSWEYDDPCGRLATARGRSRHRVYSGIGGSVPVRLVGDAARPWPGASSIWPSWSGAEALATRRHLAEPDWSHPPAEPRPFPITLDRDEAANGIYQAYLTFALLDTARRAPRGVSPADHRDTRPPPGPADRGGRVPARARLVPHGPDGRGAHHARRPRTAGWPRPTPS